ncbi:SUMF1/EgtB/PvdO family nonheme iron enzyme, partial [Mesotoga sp. BH458_6_3_2_1]|uniref:formylglycine-generating enzyme family protein n=1 Tax=Mesotoga sp. BH458_6_3_2_1 TaxID=1437446 RepID=UPI0011C45131
MKNRVFTLCLLVLIAAVVLFITGCPPVPNTLPTITKVSGPSGTISQSSSTFSWNGSDPDGTITKYEYRKDGGNWVSNGTSTSFTWSEYSEDSHTFEVMAQDNKGAYSNIISWSFEYSVGPVLLEQMIRVEGGTFMMGDTWGDGWSDELPVHEVTLAYDFEIGKYEVTFDDYDIFCEATGSSKPDDCGWGRGTRPVIYVSWRNAIAYCNWLSAKAQLPEAYDNDGKLLDGTGNVTTDITKVIGYRLPTEAEWEYAARGGTHNSTHKYSGSDDVENVAWYSANSGETTHEVGTKQPNELEIYDMSGNVGEFCSDWYGSYKGSPQTNPFGNSGIGLVNRGGDWFHSADHARISNRPLAYSQNYTSPHLGFRLCRTLESENAVPTITKVSGPSGTISQSSSTFSWNGNDPDGTITKYEYRKDGGSWVSNGTSTSYTWSGYTEDSHTFEVRAQDNEGAYSSTVSWSFVYDEGNQAPTITKVSGPSGTISQSSST